jgi:hypothetical protein
MSVMDGLSSMDDVGGAEMMCQSSTQNMFSFLDFDFCRLQVATDARGE